MLLHMVVPRVSRIAEGHEIGLALQHQADREEDEGRGADGKTEPPVPLPQSVGDAERVVAEGAQLVPYGSAL